MDEGRKPLTEAGTYSTIKVISEDDLDQAVLREVDEAEHWIEWAVQATKKSCSVIKSQEFQINAVLGSLHHSSSMIDSFLPSHLASADDFRVVSKGIHSVSALAHYRSSKQGSSKKRIEDFLRTTNMMDYALNYMLNVEIYPRLLNALFDGKSSCAFHFQFNRVDKKVMGMFNLERIKGMLEKRKFKCTLDQNPEDPSEHVFGVSWFGQSECKFIETFVKGHKMKTEAAKSKGEIKSTNDEGAKPTVLDINEEIDISSIELVRHENSEAEEEEEEIEIYSNQ